MEETALARRNFGTGCMLDQNEVWSNSLWGMVPLVTDLHCVALQESRKPLPSHLLCTGESENLDLLAWNQLA